MELQQIRYFLAVAETQHVTRTAERLHVAQPALTQSIHRLEKELEVPLFIRRGRGILLTEYGKALREKIAPLMQELDREPTAEEIAAAVDGMTPEKVVEIQRIALDPVSLETPAGDEESSLLMDFIQDTSAVDPAKHANDSVLKEQMDLLLKELPEREEKIVRMRFGLDGSGRPKTLEEVGRECSVTRERIRQIESKALRRLHRSLEKNKDLRDLKD